MQYSLSSHCVGRTEEKMAAAENTANSKEKTKKRKKRRTNKSIRKYFKGRVFICS